MGDRGGVLTVVLVPSKIQVEALSDAPPYQDAIAEYCDELGIEHRDLAPAIEPVWPRAYFRKSMHWNARGHRAAADTLWDYLTN